MKFEEFAKKVEELGRVLDNAEEPKLDITTLKPGDSVFKADIRFIPGNVHVHMRVRSVEKVTRKQFILDGKEGHYLCHHRVSDGFGGWKQTREDAIITLAINEHRKQAWNLDNIESSMIDGGLNCVMLLADVFDALVRSTKKSSTP